MKHQTSKILAGLLGLLVLLLPARGEITARVYPGYVFSDGEEITVDKMNQAATPTVEVTGTLGGTNVALGANTVTGTMLSDTVVDDITTEFNGSSPRAIKVKYDNTTLGVISSHLAVKDASISTAKLIDTSVTAGKLDTNWLADVTAATIATNDVLLIGLGGSAGHTNSRIATVQDLAKAVTNTPAFIHAVQLVTTNTFTSAEFSVGSVGAVADTPHGFAATPTKVYWVLVCKTTDAGYAVGDELDVAAFSGAGDTTPFSGGANAANIFLSCRSASLSVAAKGTGSGTAIVPADWRAKGYAAP